MLETFNSTMIEGQLYYVPIIFPGTIIFLNRLTDSAKYEKRSFSCTPMLFNVEATIAPNAHSGTVNLNFRKARANSRMPSAKPSSSSALHSRMMLLTDPPLIRCLFAISSLDRHNNRRFSVLRYRWLHAIYS
jgi:hypothetical protein